MKTFCLFGLSLFAFCSCQERPHATIHSHFAASSEQLSAVMVNAQQYEPSWSDGALTGYKLRGVQAELPRRHEEFTLLPTYPLTHSVWLNPELLQRSGQRLVRIELSKQRGQYLVDGEVAMDFPVCTGCGSKRTPVGMFRIKQKHIDHHSNLYDCPMPYFMRLTWGGIGMHVGDIYRRPASHGCIRIPRVACEPLYHALPYGSMVHVVQ